MRADGPRAGGGGEAAGGSMRAGGPRAADGAEVAGGQVRAGGAEVAGGQVRTGEPRAAGASETAGARGKARGPGRPRDPGNDRAILRAALEMFAERGMDAASLDGIARRAGVARLTLYRRWSSKEELIAQAIESALDGLVRPGTDDAADEASLAELVERSIPASVAAVTDPVFSAMLAQIVGSSVRYPRLMEIYWERYVLPRRRSAAALLERAKAEGVLAADADVDVLIDMMAGAVMYRVIRPEPLGAEESRRYLESVYREAGLLPRSAA